MAYFSCQEVSCSVALGGLDGLIPLLLSVPAERPAGYVPFSSVVSFSLLSFSVSLQALSARGGFQAMLPGRTSLLKRHHRALYIMAPD